MDVVSRATVEYGGLASSTRATESSRSRCFTRYVRPWWRWTAPSWTVVCAEPASTVPSSRPVPASTICTGLPPSPRMSVRSAARSRRVQCHAVVRRRSSFAASSCGSRSAAAGPKSSRSSSVRGSRRRRRTGAGRGRTGCRGRGRWIPPAVRTGPLGGARGRCPAGRRGRRGWRVRPAPSGRRGPPAATGGPGSRVARDDDGVQAGDVDAEFEAVVAARPRSSPECRARSRARRSSGR